MPIILKFAGGRVNCLLFGIGMKPSLRKCFVVISCIGVHCPLLPASINKLNGGKLFHSNGPFLGARVVNVRSKLEIIGCSDPCWLLLHGQRFCLP
jgi:hypothetical protein